jgi:hypothetical protein
METKRAGDVAFDVASLVALRIGVGLGIAAYAAALLLRVPPFQELLSAPTHVPYRDLSWVIALPPNGLRAIAVLLVASGIAMAAGFRYRVTAPLAAGLALYLFFIDAIYFESVAYLAALLLVLLAASPAHCIFSLDARGGPLPCHGGRASLSIIRFQVACVYVFSGIAKCYPGWIKGHAMEAMAPHYALARWLDGIVSRHDVFVLMSWMGLLFDLAIVPLVRWRKTRRAAFVVLVAFHVHNAFMLSLGSVPWTMIGVSTIFLDPDWPRRLWKKLPASPADLGLGAKRWPRALIAAWVVVQIALPLRRWVTPGDPMFHEIGYDFTWALRSRVKDSSCFFTVVDRATGAKSMQTPFPELGPRVRLRVANDPYLIWRGAQAVANGRDVSVYATTAVILDGGRPSLLVDRDVDLAHATFPALGVPSWVYLRASE